MRVHALVLAAMLGLALGDLYLKLDGSNNRLNERSATRAENNRLFDSQNNARGGRNVGDKTSEAFNGNNPLNENLEQLYSRSNNDASQYPMMYYEASELVHEWTAQHGCGGNDANDPYNVNCNFVLQYTCDTNTKGAQEKDLEVAIADGGNTGQPKAPNTYAEAEGVRNTNNEAKFGRHENEYYYAMCKTRNRNKGLFIADRNLQGDSSIYTRQNNNGGRSGLECPEERDYYPYWTPTPWRDIAYLTTEIGNNNVDICNVVRSESQNVKDKYRCGPIDDANKAKYNNKEECEANAGTWQKVDKFGLPAPECRQADWSRDNHLGDGRDGTPANYTWILPTFAQLQSQGFKTYGANNDMIKCTFRMRYNMTTADYDGWGITSESNGNKSPVRNNPTVDIGANLQGLKLALNTAQTGRVFQDRTHMFFIKKRPAAFAGKRIINFTVRGKRGNIVQVFPHVEYDFTRHNGLRISRNDLLHIQWSGSNTHNNGANGGDGQTGDDGQGQGGTDRNNLVLTKGEGDNWPLALDKAEDHMFKHTKCWNTDAAATRLGSDTNWLDCAITLASSGYYSSAAEVATKEQINNQMNNAPASLAGGVMVQVTKAGTYYYMCSRNNNFTNRSQKGFLIVV